MEPSIRKVVKRSPAHTVRLLHLPHLQPDPIEADSSVERDFVHVAALYPHTRAILHQPFRLTLDAASYTPDFLVSFADGSKAVIEVKPTEFVASYAELFANVRKKLAAHGLVFVVARDTVLRHDGLSERALLIRRYAKGQCDRSLRDRAMRMVQASESGVQVRALRAAGVPLEIIMHLICYRDLQTTIDLILNDDAVITAPHTNTKESSHAIRFAGWLDA